MPASATVSIASNDSTANPFTFAVSGVGTLSGLLAQSIVLSTPATVLVNEGPVPLQVHATSGLPVTLSVLSGPATLAGTSLIPNGVGTVKLQATQAGDALYQPAKTVIRSRAKSGRTACSAVPVRGRTAMLNRSPALPSRLGCNRPSPG